MNLPRILIIVRVGRNSIHRSWIWTLHNLADVAISVYDDSDYANDGARYLHRFVGGKFPGITSFFAQYPQALEDYDYFWMYEDDLTLPFESLRRLSSLLSRFSFDLAAPALSYDSFFTWPITVANNQFQFRGTNFVEVMAPIMSRSFLKAAMPAFNENFSGWGHEWLWRKLLEDRQTFAVIVDAAQVTHTRPFGRGSLRVNSPSGAYEPKKELDAFVAKYELDVNVQFSNLFGVTRDPPQQLLIQDAFLQMALAGYQEMHSLPTDTFVRCIDSLIRGTRPYVGLVNLREMPSFRMVEDALANVERGPINSNLHI